MKAPDTATRRRAPRRSWWVLPHPWCTPALDSACCRCGQGRSPAQQPTWCTPAPDRTALAAAVSNAVVGGSSRQFCTRRLRREPLAFELDREWPPSPPSRARCDIWPRTPILGWARLSWRLLSGCCALHCIALPVRPPVMVGATRQPPFAYWSPRNQTEAVQLYNFRALQGSLRQGVAGAGLKYVATPKDSVCMRGRTEGRVHRVGPCLRPLSGHACVRRGRGSNPANGHHAAR